MGLSIANVVSLKNICI